MTPLPDVQRAGTSPDAELIFGAKTVLALLDSFEQEISGVREGKDPEYLHRMRVASRRLRAALPLAMSHQKQKEYTAWLKQVKEITRSLGAARDLDVQITFLKKYRKSLVKGARETPDSRDLLLSAGHESDDASPKNISRSVDPSKDPITIHINRLTKKRKPVQDDVIHALDQLEKNHLPDHMRNFFLQNVPVRKSPDIKASLCGIPLTAADRIGEKIRAVHHYSPWVHNPDSAFEHHALRIATKKLRYTLEYYAPAYRRRFTKQLLRIKKLQDLLGDIHDCDVWIDQVSIAIVRQRCRSHSSGDIQCAGISTVAPLRRLLQNREKQRKLLYRQFVRFWDKLERTGFWDELSHALLYGQKSLYRYRTCEENNDSQDAFRRLCLGQPDLEAHAETVTRLSLRLFDELAPLHQLGKNDRKILENAARVHDVGWKYGQEGHQKKSAEMILSCCDLPVSLPDQALIALVAGFHGGRPKVRLPGVYTVLDKRDQKRSRMLGALLRVADGLDYSHAGIVSDLKCSCGEPEVYCELIVSADAGIEKARAQKKSDLFSTVFGRPLVIQ